MRRVFATNLTLGRVALSPDAAKHLVQVLRLTDGTEVQAFDATGQTAVAVLRIADAHPNTRPDKSAAGSSGGKFWLEVSRIEQASRSGWNGVVATAVPKGERADWLVEKLAELGVRKWVPLDTARAVVVPKGEGKRARWERIAQEAARQSHSPGVMEIGELTRLDAFSVEVSALGGLAWFGSTGEGAVPALQAHSQGSPAGTPAWVLIGPEGGWTPEEEAALVAAGMSRVTFGATVLRVETAAIVAATLAGATLRPPNS